VRVQELRTAREDTIKFSNVNAELPHGGTVDPKTPEASAQTEAMLGESFAYACERETVWREELTRKFTATAYSTQTRLVALTRFRNQRIIQRVSTDVAEAATGPAI
jgi:hypothetical protein